MHIEKTGEGITMSINIKCLWKDRKRHLGLPLSFTRYQMSEDRLFISEGFLNIKDDECFCTASGTSTPGAACGSGYSASAR